MDVGFWGGVVPDNIPGRASGDRHVLESLVDAGVRGFKCFLVPSGVDEFHPVDEPQLRRFVTVMWSHSSERFRS